MLELHYKYLAKNSITLKPHQGMNNPHWAPEETHHLLETPLTEIQNININHTGHRLCKPIPKQAHLKKKKNHSNKNKNKQTRLNPERPIFNNRSKRLSPGPGSQSRQKPGHVPTQPATETEQMAIECSKQANDMFCHVH